MRMNIRSARILFIVLTFMVISIYICFFILKKDKSIFIEEKLLPIAPLILIAMACTKFQDVAYKVDISGIPKMLFFLKIPIHSLICQILINIFSSNWHWWILSIVIGTVVSVIEELSPHFAEGNH